MATYPRHLKAKAIRDYMIETNTVSMFKEEENETTIFFRSLYEMDGDRVQLVININDTPHLGFQCLLASDVKEEKIPAVLETLNKCNYEIPAIKYVLTDDKCVVVSMFIPVDADHMNPALIMATFAEILKSVNQMHYKKIKEVVGKESDSKVTDLNAVREETTQE